MNYRIFWLWVFWAVLKIFIFEDWPLLKKYNILIMEIGWDCSIWYISYGSQKVTASVWSDCFSTIYNLYWKPAFKQAYILWKAAIHRNTAKIYPQTIQLWKWFLRQYNLNEKIQPPSSTWFWTWQIQLCTSIVSNLLPDVIVDDLLDSWIF